MIILGNYLVLLASTISGYEGTGRSLSLKLIAQLRNRIADKDTDEGETTTDHRGAQSRRTLYELTLEESIRYGMGDPVVYIDEPVNVFGTSVAD